MKLEGEVFVAAVGLGAKGKAVAGWLELFDAAAAMEEDGDLGGVGDAEEGATVVEAGRLDDGEGASNEVAGADVGVEALAGDAERGGGGGEAGGDGAGEAEGGAGEGGDEGGGHAFAGDVAD